MLIGLPSFMPASLLTYSGVYVADIKPPIKASVAPFTNMV